MKTVFEHISTQIIYCCSQPRYRTFWLIGAPLCGKSTLVRQICEVYSWQYINYTLDNGFLNSISDKIETYQPADLLRDIRIWCNTYSQSIVVIDEIDAILAIWSHDQRKLFATQVSRMSSINGGLVLVSNFFEGDTLAPLLPNSDVPFYVDLSGV